MMFIYLNLQEANDPSSVSNDQLHAYVEEYICASHIYFYTQGKM